jgi:hypothetical protein
MVQVAGSLNTPAYRWPLSTGITCCVLAPIAYGLEQLGWKGVGRIRPIIAILTFLGPIGLLSIGVVSLIFALAVRQARIARRRDLEDLSDGFALIDRRGRREYQDGEVEALGFRSRLAAQGSVSTQKGLATLWVVGAEGPEVLVLNWEYPDLAIDPLAGFLNRLAERLCAQSSRLIDSGGTIEGEGWTLSRPGLLVGDAFDIVSFAEVAAVESHDGFLQVWRVGEVEPFFKVAEGSKNEVVLRAILDQRKSKRIARATAPEIAGEGLGRILFERRPKASERFAYWLLALLISTISVGVAGFAIRSGASILWGAPALLVVVAIFLVALAGQLSRFRFHERGVAKLGLRGIREIPFADLAEVKPTLMSYETLLELTFKPTKGRGLKKVSVLLKPTDAALETIHAFIPAEKFRS